MLLGKVWFWICLMSPRHSTSMAKELNTSSFAKGDASCILTLAYVDFFSLALSPCSISPTSIWDAPLSSLHSTNLRPLLVRQPTSYNMTADPFLQENSCTHLCMSEEPSFPNLLSNLILASFWLASRSSPPSLFFPLFDNYLLGWVSRVFRFDQNAHM